MVWPLIAEALYPPQHPYNWLTIGVMEDVERATMEDVSAFFRRYYVPSNASLAVVGDLEEDHAYSLAERYFGPIPGERQRYGPGRSNGRWLEDESDRSARSRRAGPALPLWPTVAHFHDDDATLVAAGRYPGRGRSSRLYRKLVIEEQIAQDVSAYQSGRELAGSFGIVVTLRPSRSIAEAIGFIDSELAGATAATVPNPSFAASRRLRVAAFWFALEHIGGFGGVADRLNAYNIYRGDPGKITSDVERFERVTASEIRAAAQRYLLERPRVELSVVGRGNRVKPTPLDRTVAPASALAVDYRPPLPRIMELGRGIPLWVFPRGDLPTVTGAIVMPGGAGLQRPGEAGLAQLTAVMLDEGTVSRSSEQIALAAESMGATITATCGWGGAYVSFKCLKTDYPASLELVADILKNPTFPEAEWGRVRGQAVAALRAERDQRRIVRDAGSPGGPLSGRPPLSISALWHGSRCAAARSSRPGRFSREVFDFHAADDHRRGGRRSGGAGRRAGTQAHALARAWNRDRRSAGDRAIGAGSVAPARPPGCCPGGRSGRLRRARPSRP